MIYMMEIFDTSQRPDVCQSLYKGICCECAGIYA